MRREIREMRRDMRRDMRMEMWREISCEMWITRIPGSHDKAKQTLRLEELTMKTTVTWQKYPSLHQGINRRSVQGLSLIYPARRREGRDRCSQAVAGRRLPAPGTARHWLTGRLLMDGFIF